MLDENKLAREEMVRKPETAVKGKRSWMFKAFLILIVMGIVLYLFTNPDRILDPVNKFFNNLLK